MRNFMRNYPEAVPGLITVAIVTVVAIIYLIAG
jgi:hypothetical protein